jgi:hypothetical protein
MRGSAYVVLQNMRDINPFHLGQVARDDVLRFIFIVLYVAYCYSLLFGPAVLTRGLAIRSKRGNSLAIKRR